MLTALLSACAVAAVSQPDLPTITVTRDNTAIDRSCRIVIPQGTIIADTDDNGVIQIVADGIVVECVEGQAELLADDLEGDWDRKTGYGFFIDGRKNVTLRNARAHRFKCGIFASDADGLVLENCDVSGGFAHRLRSTPQAEDGGDWLWPHQNESNEWLHNYGAGIYVEESDNVTIRDCFARRRQNGIVLDTVTNSKIYDNDCSFLSGWGLAMWRCTDNVVSRNAFDFCVRGYSHGVYNRGQDSAGILFFEQNSRNYIVENSATHGGDGLFAFAGLDALGERWLEQERRRLRRETGRDNVDDLINVTPEIAARFKRLGCNDNHFIGNDLSYAPAHGLELTFSFGNVIADNRMVENAICGIWGGFSQDTLIVRNTFEGNGEMAYGLERGGINIEHGAGNVIAHNTFRDNKCAIHLWWDNPGNFLSTPWGRANYRGVTDNVIAGNTFIGDRIALQLRDDSTEGTKVVGTRYFQNDARNVGRELDVKAGIEIVTSGEIPAVPDLAYPVYGQKRPVGARPHLAGRHNIIMTEWFPWDHTSPIARKIASGKDGDVYEFHAIEPADVKFEGEGVRFVRDYKPGAESWTGTVTSHASGVFPYSIIISAEDYNSRIDATLMRAEWHLTAFEWTPDERGAPVPPPDLNRWRDEALSDRAVSAVLHELRLPFGGGSPSTLNLSPEITAASIPGDYFGIIARTRMRLSPGTWRVRTNSDDGVRVMVNGETVIENWTHHGATWDEGTFELARPREVTIEVEYFEIFGAAALEFRLEPVR